MPGDLGSLIKVGNLLREPGSSALFLQGAVWKTVPVGAHCCCPSWAGQLMRDGRNQNGKSQQPVMPSSLWPSHPALQPIGNKPLLIAHNISRQFFLQTLNEDVGFRLCLIPGARRAALLSVSVANSPNSSNSSLPPIARPHPFLSLPPAAGLLTRPSWGSALERPKLLICALYAVVIFTNTGKHYSMGRCRTQYAGSIFHEIALKRWTEAQNTQAWHRTHRGSPGSIPNTEDRGSIPLHTDAVKTWYISPCRYGYGSLPPPYNNNHKKREYGWMFCIHLKCSPLTDADLIACYFSYVALCGCGFAEHPAMLRLEGTAPTGRACWGCCSGLQGLMRMVAWEGWAQSWSPPGLTTEAAEAYSDAVVVESQQLPARKFCFLTLDTVRKPQLPEPFLLFRARTALQWLLSGYVNKCRVMLGGFLGNNNIQCQGAAPVGAFRQLSLTVCHAVLPAPDPLHCWVSH